MIRGSFAAAPLVFAPAFVGAVAMVVTVMASEGIASAQSPPAAPDTIAVGDWQLAPTLQLRTRGEYRRDPVDMGGMDQLGGAGSRVRDSWAIFERARLGLGAEKGVLRAQLTIQDARAWGSPAPTAILGQSGGVGGIAAYEAYVEARTSSARPAFVRVGRQALTWGEGRLVSNADWSMAARTLDAIRGHASAGLWDFELFAAVLDSPAPLGVAAGDTAGPTRAGTQLYGLQGAWPIDPLLKVELSAYARVSRRGQFAPDLSRFSHARAEGETYTGSLRVAGDSRGWKYDVEGAYQLGRATGLGLGDGVARQAFAVAGFVQRTFDQLSLTPTFRAGAGFASGDDGSSSTYHQFDPLLGDVQTLHGAMDTFAWSNLADVNARATIVPTTDMRASLQYRYARLAEASGEWIGGYLQRIGSAPGSASGSLGHELDAFLSWRPSFASALELVGGYSALLLGDGARTILAAQARGRLQSDGTFSPADVAHYGYLHATLIVP